jgi:hypothetical protein
MSDLAELQPFEVPTRRRGAMGMLAKGGMLIVGGLAGILGTATPAAADCQGSPCCSLASCTKCSGSCHYTCPSGWRRAYWGCMAGTRVIFCGECVKGGSGCSGSSYYCSVWWDDGVCV